MEFDIVEPHELLPAPDFDVDGLRVGRGQRERQVLVAVDSVLVHRDKGIPRFQPGGLQRGIGGELRNRRGVEHRLLPQKDHHQHEAEQDVHHRAHHDDQNPLPHRLVVERLLVRAVLVFPFHGAETADGKQAQRILGSPFFKVAQQRAHAHGEFVHAHAGELRRKKMAELVDENHKSEQKNCYDD